MPFDVRPGLVVLLLVGSAEAATYHVATDGDDARSCDQASQPGSPRRTIAMGAKGLAAGDTLFVGAGSYDEELKNPLPSGLSAAQPTTLTGPGGKDRPVIRPTGGTGQALLLDEARSNIRFTNFVIDARASTRGVFAAVYAN